MKSMMKFPGVLLVCFFCGMVALEAAEPAPAPISQLRVKPSTHGAVFTYVADSAGFGTVAVYSRQPTGRPDQDARFLVTKYPRGKAVVLPSRKPSGRSESRSLEVGELKPGTLYWYTLAVDFYTVSPLKKTGTFSTHIRID